MSSERPGSNICQLRIKFTYSSVGKAIEKQTERIKNQGRKQVDTLEVLKSTKHQETPKWIEWIFLKDLENNKINDELNKINKSDENVNKNDLIYETNKCTYNFQQFKAIRYFGESIYDGKIAISKANHKGSNLINNILEFHDKNTEKSKVDKEKNSSTYKRVNNIYEGSELTLNALKIRIFSLKSTQGKGTKILTLKQMLQRFNPPMLISRSCI